MRCCFCCFRRLPAASIRTHMLAPQSRPPSKVFLNLSLSEPSHSLPWPSFSSLATKVEEPRHEGLHSRCHHSLASTPLPPPLLPFQRRQVEEPRHEGLDGGAVPAAAGQRGAAAAGGGAPAAPARAGGHKGGGGGGHAFKAGKTALLWQAAGVSTNGARHCFVLCWCPAPRCLSHALPLPLLPSPPPTAGHPQGARRGCGAHLHHHLRGARGAGHHGAGVCACVRFQALVAFAVGASGSAIILVLVWVGCAGREAVPAPAAPAPGLPRPLLLLSRRRRRRRRPPPPLKCGQPPPPPPPPRARPPRLAEPAAGRPALLRLQRWQRRVCGRGQQEPGAGGADGLPGLLTPRGGCQLGCAAVVWARQRAGCSGRRPSLLYSVASSSTACWHHSLPTVALCPSSPWHAACRCCTWATASPTPATTAPHATAAPSCGWQTLRKRVSSPGFLGVQVSWRWQQHGVRSHGAAAGSGCQVSWRCCRLPAASAAGVGTCPAGAASGGAAGAARGQCNTTLITSPSLPSSPHSPRLFHQAAAGRHPAEENVRAHLHRVRG